ncbi:MAG: YbhB/YbcL family Raf kinase inhibitor-like protein [Dehalococcoidales bacterium]
MLTISSPDFKNNETMPAILTGEGANVSPALFWKGVPDGTVSLAIIMDDPDAPTGLFTHWILFNLPPDTKELPQAVPTKLNLENGALQGKNTANKIGYYGPYPPIGPPHRYQFHLYALDKMLNIEAGATRKQVISEIESSAIATAMLTGIYQRTAK